MTRDVILEMTSYHRWSRYFWLERGVIKIISGGGGVNNKKGWFKLFSPKLALVNFFACQKIKKLLLLKKPKRVGSQKQFLRGRGSFWMLLVGGHKKFQQGVAPSNPTPCSPVPSNSLSQLLWKNPQTVGCEINPEEEKWANFYSNGFPRSMSW